MSVLPILEEANRYSKKKFGLDTQVRFFNEVVKDITNEADFPFMIFKDSLTTTKNGIITVLDFSDLSLATITITLNDVDTTITEGTNWTAAVDNDTTAGTINTAINAIVGVKSTVVSNVVTMERDGITNTIDKLATSALAADMTVELTAQKIYNLSDINDGTTGQTLVKRIIEIEKPDDASTTQSTTIDGRLLPSGNRVFGWRLRNTILEFLDDPPATLLDIFALHKPIPLETNTVDSYTLLIPIDYHGLVETGMKRQMDLDLFETSPQEGNYQNRLRQLLADFKSRHNADDLAHEIALSARLDDGTLIENF